MNKRLFISTAPNVHVWVFKVYACSEVQASVKTVAPTAEVDTETYPSFLFHIQSKPIAVKASKQFGKKKVANQLYQTDRLY